MLKSSIKTLVLGLGVIVFVFLFTITLVSVAKAQGNQNQGQNQPGVQNNKEDAVPQLINEEGTSESLGEAKGKKENDNNRGQLNATSHRSAVANFVQSLLGVADRQPGGIGEQVRVMAQQQNESTEKVAGAMEKVQTRSKIRTFLFGSDYKNLGTLRSEMVQTKNRLDQLSQVMAEVENEGDKTELQNQIQLLTQEQGTLENFILENEQAGKISMFGWLVRLFN